MSSPDSLPDAIVAELMRLFDGPDAGFWPGVVGLCERHPTLAPAIQREAESLQAELRRGRSSGSTQPAVHGDGDADLRPGDRVGPFVVLDVIGHGGMGSVYLAEQKEPVRRRVALKVIKLGMDTKEVLARFEVERQALALMDHSHIAKVLEAGITPKGKPYFAMEHIKGVPITRYCDDQKLSIEERLALFKQVCSGVQHAHTKGVIHRDLTPNNVLVTLQDGKPAAKIIDFGLARATDQRLTERTLYTQWGRILGTPEYMSPEQAGVNMLDIDMRTDVYTLGVLLYELLAGKPPFEGKHLRAQSYEHMCKTIREAEPPRPSTKVTSGGSEAVAQLRRTDARVLLKRLRGDLDWVVLKCLEKDRTRRYETVSHLADDVERYLANEPVLARAPSVAYRLAKFARRYRGQLLAVAAVFVALTAGLGLALRFWREAAESAEQAQRLAAEALASRREFDQLAVAVHLERLRKQLDALAQPWKELTPARQWLADADLLLARRPELQTVVATLRTRALPLTPEQVDDDVRAHPRFAEWQRLRRKLERLDILCSSARPSPWLLPELRSAQAALLLALDFDGSCHGMRGESPLDSEGIEFGPGVWGQAAAFGATSRLAFAATPSIDPREGSVSLWISPDWPTPGVDHYWLQLGSGGGILLGKDALDNLRFIMDRFHPTERSVGSPIGAWRCGDWHHVVFTWSNRERRMHLYVDGARVGSAHFWQELPVVEADRLQVGRGDPGALNGRLDMLCVYARPLTADEVECLFDARPVSAGEFAKLSAEQIELSNLVHQRRTWIFPSDIDGQAVSFLHDALTGVDAKLAEFEVAERMVAARRLRCAEVSRKHPRAQFSWADAAKAIETADGEVASALYRQVPIKLAPHLGLVPIGMNPVTKLWEFYELCSAWDSTKVSDPAELEIPKHDAQGRIEVGDDTGIVFVLLPGGHFMMGAQRADRDGPNYDPMAEPREGPPHRVRLSPFFLARHELTQGQWRRLRGGAGSVTPSKVGDTFPLGGVSWLSSQASLRAHGLTLPTEAQWEYGCRAGTTTPWWTGREESSLGDELGDLRPVGGGRSNAFGLHGVHGNVWEWCLDAWDDSSDYGDDIADPCSTSGSPRVFRGGSWNFSARGCRSAYRNANVPGYADFSLGFRPALAARSDVK